MGLEELTGIHDIDSYKGFMKLACKEAGKCSPVSTAYNVGCVIVEGDQVVATGFSREFEGNTHAEECALLKMEKHAAFRGDVSKEYTLFTTMEPCSKRLSGKKSCTERIVAFGSIHTVVIGCKEPTHFVLCEGSSQLEANGIHVVLLEDFSKECLSANMHIC
eukprot:Sdes_comp22234_c0_seq1m20728